jgi:Cu/Ag efflux protein CusF
MRKTFGLASVLMGFVAAVNAAPLSNSQDTTVTSVDRSGKKFTVQSGFGNSIYNTTDRTVFRVGTTPTAWTEIKAGSKVSIIYHLDGDTHIADEVLIVY